MIRAAQREDFRVATFPIVQLVQPNADQAHRSMKI
jgi:hypothetical protein